MAEIIREIVHLRGLLYFDFLTICKVAKFSTTASN
jgi:hypothetical protein